MNVLKRAITAQPSRKWRFLLYSTTYTLNPAKPPRRTHLIPPQPASSSSSISDQIKRELGKKSSDWPRPSEIPYQPKVKNLVNLIGQVRTPIKYQTTPDGKYWAGTFIYQENGPQGSCLIPVLFEGDLAHVVTCHVKENDCVYITGQLSEAELPFVLSSTPRFLHLRVKDINFVKDFEKNGFEDLVLKSSDIVKEEEDGEYEEKKTIDSADRKSGGGAKKKGGDDVLDSWRDLVQNSKQWMDYRGQKAKGLVADKYPDFKNKDTGVGLWIRTAPRWVLGGLKSLEFDVPTSKQKQVKDAKADGLWKSLAENPKNWWDNRLGKRNPKAPDFKHKETGEVLWLESAPVWVLSMLPPTRENPVNA